MDLGSLGTKATAPTTAARGHTPLLSMHRKSLVKASMCEGLHSARCFNSTGIKPSIPADVGLERKIASRISQAFKRGRSTSLRCMVAPYCRIKTGEGRFPMLMLRINTSPYFHDSLEACRDVGGKSMRSHSDADRLGACLALLRTWP